MIKNLVSVVIVLGICSCTSVKKEMTEEEFRRKMQALSMTIDPGKYRTIIDIHNIKTTGLNDSDAEEAKRGLLGSLPGQHDICIDPAMLNLLVSHFSDKPLRDGNCILSNADFSGNRYSYTWDCVNNKTKMHIENSGTIEEIRQYGESLSKILISDRVVGEISFNTTTTSEKIGECN